MNGRFKTISLDRPSSSFVTSGGDGDIDGSSMNGKCTSNSSYTAYNFC